MFTVARFAITKTQKHPKCPLKDEWIKNMSCTHTYTMEYYSPVKRMK